MRKFFALRILVAGLLLLVGCNLLPGRAEPPPITVENVAIQRFLTRAPLPAPMVATITPDPTYLISIPRGLPLPLVDPLQVTGNLTISGSPALAPLTRRLYAAFVNDGYRDTIRIEEINTSSAFARYCTEAPDAPGAIDIVMADRPLQQDELARCWQQKRRPFALRVALSTVVVASPAALALVADVSQNELAQMFTAPTWAAVRRDWPAEAITRFAPPVGSIPATLFVEKILGREHHRFTNATAMTLLDDKQAIAFALAETPYSVGLLTFADYQQNRSGLQLWAINGRRPDAETVSSGAYLLTYPLLLYTDEATLTAKAQSGAFLLYYLAQMNDALATVGLFPMDEASYERAKTILLSALGQETYLAQFPPTSTPVPPTATPTVTPTLVITGTMTVTR